jgi:oligopeptide transport system substrate-binding protein
MKLYFSIIFLILSAHASAQNVLNRGNGSEPDSLNIHLAEGLNSHNILRDLYEGLMTTSEDGKPIYGAAISHSNEGNTWTFKLRPNAKWSDGSLVVANDFVRAWHKAVNPVTAAPYAFLFDNLRDGHKAIPEETLQVKVIDNYTLQITLKQYDDAFLEKLSLPVFYPLPKVTIKNRQIISNGAYQLKDWKIQEKITLQKNPHYYTSNSTYYDQVIYWVTEDQSSELKRFRAGDLDITESIPDSQIKWIKQNLPEELHIAPYIGSFFLGLNISDKHLKNPLLRQALSLAIDRKILTEKVLKTGQQAAYHVVPRNLTSNTSAHIVKSNKALAQLRLKESAVDIEDLSIEILYNNSQNQKKVAIAIAAMWRQTLGIKTQLLNQEWKVFVQSRKSDKRQAFRSGWIADYADALSFLELFTSQSRFNFYHYKNPHYDEIVKNINITTDPYLRESLIDQAEILLLQDMPVIPLYYYVSRHLVKKHIMGYTDNVADRHLSKYLYKKEKL